MEALKHKLCWKCNTEGSGFKDGGDKLCRVVCKSIQTFGDLTSRVRLSVCVRCSRQYRGEDAASGVCPEQEESPGSAKPKPLSAR